MEQDFIKLQSNLLFLVSFWYTHVVPICIEDWVSIVENQILVLVQVLFFLVYLLCTGFSPNY